MKRCLGLDTLAIMPDSLFLVLRAPEHPEQKFRNVFDEESLPIQIETTPEIADKCKQAKANGETVFIHRAGMEDLAPSIICSVKIAAVREINPTTALVEFSEHKKLNNNPAKKLPKGTSFYYA